MLEQLPAPPGETGARRRRVLVAEDDAALRRLIEIRLGLDPTLEVTAVGDGRAVLRAVDEAVPDLLICDIMMPQVSGLSVCRQLRAAGVTVPIILLSAQQQDDAVDAVIKLGGVEFMNKPYDAATLRTRMTALLDAPQPTA
ncbi:MAG: response regulator transcription factor [Candidatus Dormibacteria bacterium]